VHLPSNLYAAKALKNFKNLLYARFVADFSREEAPTIAVLVARDRFKYRFKSWALRLNSASFLENIPRMSLK